MEIRSQCASIRTAGTAPQVFPPPAGIVPSLRPEVRERASRGDLWLHSDREPFRSPQPGDFISAQAPTWRFSWCCPVPLVRLAGEFASAGSSSLGTTSRWTLRISAVSALMLALAVFSTLSFLHPVPLGQAATSPKPVERPQMLGDSSLSRQTSKQEAADWLQNFSIPWILINPFFVS